MLEYFKYIIDLKKYNKKIDENDKLYKDLIEKAKRNNKPEEDIRKISDEWRAVNIDPELDIKILETKYLIKRANKYNVPWPRNSESENYSDWQNDFGIRYLSDEGRFRLNKLIRQEKKERREGFIQLITVITGLIGAVIGLIAFISR
jgi:hypothetical protein